MPPKIPTHLFTGFLGTGKTSAIRSLIAQKPQHEQWLIIVNEFGEIGIDGAVLAENGIPVAEISGGCLCCSAGAQMDSTIRAMLKKNTPQRILIEASGLAHAAGIIDELRAPEFADTLDIAAVFTLIDPRQFIDDNYAQNPLYRDQISVADVLVASKLDLCTSEQIAAFRAKAAAWLATPTAEKSRYRIQALPENTLGYQSQGYTFPAGRDFDGEKLIQFFNDLPQFTQGLVRAKGVFQVLGTWVWLNWTDGQWGANQIAWRRDSRFELIAQAFDADEIERRLNDALEAE